MASDGAAAEEVDVGLRMQSFFEGDVKEGTPCDSYPFNL